MRKYKEVISFRAVMKSLQYLNCMDIVRVCMKKLLMNDGQQ